MENVISFAGFEGLAEVALAARSEERASRPLPRVRREDVLRAYSGKTGCMCGCRGRYYTRGEVAPECGEENTAMVTRIVNAINASCWEARRQEGLDGEQIVFLETGTRTLAVYLNASADVSGFEVES